MELEIQGPRAVCLLKLSLLTRCAIFRTHDRLPFQVLVRDFEAPKFGSLVPALTRTCRQQWDQLQRIRPAGSAPGRVTRAWSVSAPPSEKIGVSGEI